MKRNPYYKSSVTIGFNVSDILSALVQNKKELPKEFIVKMNDTVPGIFTNDILSKIKKHVDIDTEILEQNDYLIFKNGDIKITDNAWEVARATNNHLVYHLTSDYSKVVDLIENFFKNTKKQNTKCPNYCDCCTTCVIAHNCKQQSDKKIEGKKDIFGDDKRIYDGQFITTKEKVSIYYNFVKIGYDTYNIITLDGKEYVNIEGDLYTVNTNFLGQDFIQKM